MTASGTTDWLFGFPEPNLLFKIYFGICAVLFGKALYKTYVEEYKKPQTQADHRAGQNGQKQRKISVFATGINDENENLGAIIEKDQNEVVCTIKPATSEDDFVQII